LEKLDQAATRNQLAAMNVTLRIPDDLAKRLSAAGDDLSRRALEAFAVDEYRAGRLTRPELRRLSALRRAPSWPRCPRISSCCGGRESSSYTSRPIG
jgi:hypothetical protein